MSPMSPDPLATSRHLIAKQNLGYYLVSSCDAHSSEYVAPADKRREFITHFTGSAGVAIVGADDYAELATDGRYWSQAEAQSQRGWTSRKESSPRVVTWNKAISQRSSVENVSIGVDPKLISYTEARRIQGFGGDSRAVEPNLVDLVWKNRPEDTRNPVYESSTIYTGKQTSSKLTDSRHELKTAGTHAIVSSALDQIAWSSNSRGSDIEYNPVFRAFVLVTTTDTRSYIQSDGRQIPTETLAANKIEIRPYEQVYDDVKELAAQDKVVWVPPKSSWAMALAAGPKASSNRESPVELAKASKNPVEIDGAKRAQSYCGSSIVEQSSWSQVQVRAGEQISEFEAAEKSSAIRRKSPEFKELSFETISSSGPNAAIIHYSPPEEGSRLVAENEVYLLDSGSQFLFGTTDTTRTAWFSPELPAKEITEAYTLVSKGHIALATAIFPEGTHGSKLDSSARQYSWKYGSNYVHGTGHGVGSFLNVHEGPVSISMQSEESVFEGNSSSNEPGYYKPDHFGIRLENLVIVKPAAPKHASKSNFSQFETITVVPFDRNLIDVSSSSAEEINWIDEYHAKCKLASTPSSSKPALEYLEYHAAPSSS